MTVSEQVIDRLPKYARVLDSLERKGREVVSSQELAQFVFGDSKSAAQIRKDLSYFGRFGKQGRGYNVRNLLGALRHILGLDRQWRMALIGVGRLGRAILSYGGFAPQGFRIVQAFDVDPSVVGTKVDDLLVKDVADLEKELTANPVDIAIVAVPAESAQEVIDAVIRSGVRAILNYAPISVHVPKGVQVKYIDPVLALQSMTFYIKASSPAK